MGVTEIKSTTQFNEFVQSGSAIAVQATAGWGGSPSKAITPIFNMHAEVHADKPVVFARFDTDDVPELAKQLGIESIPAFCFFKGGERLDDVRGANPTKLEQAIEKLSS
jgi:thioredoxin 1